MSFDTDQREFMTLAGQSTDRINMPQAVRYIRHIAEEANETSDAYDDGDFVKTVDGLVDTIVVCLGALWSLGIDPAKAWDAVHAANMRKVDGSLGPVVKRPDGQVGKPDGWFGPEHDLTSLVAQLFAKPAR